MEQLLRVVCQIWDHFILIEGLMELSGILGEELEGKQMDSGCFMILGLNFNEEFFISPFGFLDQD